MLRREGVFNSPGRCYWMGLPVRPGHVSALLRGLSGHVGLRGLLGCVAHSLVGGIQIDEVLSLDVSEPWGVAMSDVRRVIL